MTSNRRSAPEMGNETSTAVAGSTDKAQSDQLFKVRLAAYFKGTACHLSLQIISCVSVSIRPPKMQQLSASFRLGTIHRARTAAESCGLANTVVDVFFRNGNYLCLKCCPGIFNPKLKVGRHIHTQISFQSLRFRKHMRNTVRRSTQVDGHGIKKAVRRFGTGSDVTSGQKLHGCRQTYYIHVCMQKTVAHPLR